jgi:hypothetical protein
MQNIALNSNFINFSIQLEKKLLEKTLKEFSVISKQQLSLSLNNLLFANICLKKSRVFSTESSIEALLLTDGSLLISPTAIAKKSAHKSFFTFLILKNDLSVCKKLFA